MPHYLNSFTGKRHASAGTGARSGWACRGRAGFCGAPRQAERVNAGRDGGAAPAWRRHGRGASRLRGRTRTSDGGATAAERGRRRKRSRGEGLRSGREGCRGPEEELSAERRRRAATQSGRELTAAGAAGGRQAAGGRCGSRLQPRGGGRLRGGGLGSAPRQRGGGGGRRALWCGGGTRLLLAAFERGPRCGAGQRSPPVPAPGWHEEPDCPPPLPLLEPGAGK